MASEDLDEVTAVRGAPSSRLPPPLSKLALRSDGALLVSLEDAADLVTEGREIVSFMVLTSDEHAFVTATAREFLDDRAANVLGKLPRRSE